MIKIQGQHPIDFWADQLRNERGMANTTRTRLVDAILTVERGEGYKLRSEEAQAFLTMGEYDLATRFVRAMSGGVHVHLPA